VRLAKFTLGTPPTPALCLGLFHWSVMPVLLPFLFCDAKMHHMKKATVRDLRYRFSAVEDLLRDCEEILITKRKRVIARLLPPVPVPPAAFPDFLARQKKTFGKKRLKASGAEQLAAERERF